jgi:predicted RNase H-like HicB family nuclease
LAVTTRFTYWKEADGKYLGYLNSYPDHWTQGEDLEDLKVHLRDLFGTFALKEILGIRKEEELEIA